MEKLRYTAIEPSVPTSGDVYQNNVETSQLLVILCDSGDDNWAIMQYRLGERTVATSIYTAELNRAFKRIGTTGIDLTDIERV